MDKHRIHLGIFYRDAKQQIPCRIIQTDFVFDFLGRLFFLEHDEVLRMSLSRNRCRIAERVLHHLIDRTAHMVEQLVKFRLQIHHDRRRNPCRIIIMIVIRDVVIGRMVIASGKKRRA